MDDIVTKKVESIERCLRRIEEEVAKGDLANDFTRQDAIILNLQRACEQAIDLGNHIIRKNKWEVPNTSRQTFEVLANNACISDDLAIQLKKMVGFRNIAVHEYQQLNMAIVSKISKDHLDEFREFCRIAIEKSE